MGSGDLEAVQPVVVARARSSPAALPQQVSVLLWIAANLEEIVCTAILVVMVVSVSTDVFFRYVLSSPLPWPQELSLFSLVWLTFIGSALATKRRGHIIVDFFAAFVPARARLGMELLLAVVQIAFLLLFATLGEQVMARMWVSRSPALSLPMGYVYLAVPVGCGLMILHLVRQFWAAARELAGQRGSK